jgi:hypothetical protein
VDDGMRACSHLISPPITQRLLSSLLLVIYSFAQARKSAAEKAVLAKRTNIYADNSFDGYSREQEQLK